MALRQATTEEIEAIKSGKVTPRNLKATSVGTRPPKLQKSGAEKTSEVLGTLFGGKTIGEAIGTSKVKSDIMRGEGIIETDYESLSPEAIKRLQEKGVPVTRESQRQEVVDTIKSPTGKQVFGDILASGASLVGLKGLPALTKGATLGTKALRGARIVGEGATMGAGRSLESGEGIGKGALIGGGISGAIPVVGAGLKMVGRLGKQLGAGLAGQSTDVLEAMSRNKVSGEAARVGLRDTSKKLLKDEARDLSTQVKSIRKVAGDTLGEEIDDLPKRLGRSSVRQIGDTTTIRVGDKTHTLSTRGVKSALTKVLKEFDVEVNPKSLTGSERFNFLEAPLDVAESKRLQEVFDVIQDWKDTSPKGLYKLSKKISNFRRGGTQSPELNAIIDSVSTNTRNYIGDRVPAFRPILKKYSNTIQDVEALEQGLSIKRGRPISESQLDKTQQKIRGVFDGGAEEIVRPRIESMKGGQELLAQEAGRKTAQKEFAGGDVGSSFSELLRGISSAIIPPKVIGEFAAFIGVNREQAGKVLEALKPLGRDAKIKIIRALTGE